MSDEATQRYDLDRRFAYWLGTEPDALSAGEIVMNHLDPGALPSGKTASIHFVAVLPDHSPETVVVASGPEWCDEAAVVSGVPRDERAQALAEVASRLGCEFSGVCEIMYPGGRELSLVPPSSEVLEFPPGSPEPLTPEGRPICELTDGSMFVVVDEDGTAAWSTNKTTTPYAHDVRVEVRPDARRRGLGCQLTSCALRAVTDSGTTPFYMHVRGNVASAALARSLGLRRYGTAVFAEKGF